MGGEWSEVVLGDLLHVKHGWPFKSELFSEDLTGRPIVVAIGDFRYTGGFRFESTKTKEYRGDYPDGYELEPGTLLLAMTCQTSGGEILGIPAQVPNDGRIYLHNQRLGPIVIDQPDRLDAGFVYWLCLWHRFNDHLFTTASGTKILHASPGRIESFRFPLPPLPEQRRIAAVLGALDDKIELNRKMNRTLEEMAQAIFKSWFIDFDGHDDLVDSEIGPVPRGWGVGPIDAIIEVIGGGTPKRSEPRFWDGSVPWFSVQDAPSLSDVFVLDTKEHITEAGLVKSAARLVQAGTTIISARGTVGKLAVAGQPMAFNQSCYGIGPSRGYSDEFIYFLLRSVIAHLRRSAHGSVFDTITRATFQTAHVVIPPVEKAVAFSAAVGPLLQRIASNGRETATLARLRDTLLPKLISGELRVPEAEEEVDGAIGSRKDVKPPRNNA